MYSPLDREALQRLAEKPLDTADRIAKPWLPLGRQPAPRVAKAPVTHQPGDLSPTQVRERRAKTLSAKVSALLDYYATTEVPAEQIASHLGFYRQDQTGADKQGRPIFSRVLDVKRAEDEIAWRRNAQG